MREQVPFLFGSHGEQPKRKGMVVEGWSGCGQLSFWQYELRRVAYWRRRAASRGNTGERKNFLLKNSLHSVPTLRRPKASFRRSPTNYSVLHSKQLNLCVKMYCTSAEREQPKRKGMVVGGWSGCGQLSFWQYEVRRIVYLRTQSRCEGEYRREGTRIIRTRKYRERTEALRNRRDRCAAAVNVF